jgi:hypothetical protein
MAGQSKATRMPMMAITTSNSTSVKPTRCRFIVRSPEQEWKRRNDRGGNRAAPIPGGARADNDELAKTDSPAPRATIARGCYEPRGPFRLAMLPVAQEATGERQNRATERAGNPAPSCAPGSNAGRASEKRFCLKRPPSDLAATVKLSRSKADYNPNSRKVW